MSRRSSCFAEIAERNKFNDLLCRPWSILCHFFKVAFALETASAAKGVWRYQSSRPLSIVVSLSGSTANIPNKSIASACKRLGRVSDFNCTSCSWLLVSLCMFLNLTCLLEGCIDLAQLTEISLHVCWKQHLWRGQSKELAGISQMNCTQAAQTVAPKPPLPQAVICLCLCGDGRGKPPAKPVYWRCRCERAACGDHANFQ